MESQAFVRAEHFLLHFCTPVLLRRRNPEKQAEAAAAVPSVRGAPKVRGVRDAAQEGAADAGAVQEAPQVRRRMYWAVQKDLVKGCRETLDCCCVSCELLSASIGDTLLFVNILMSGIFHRRFPQRLAVNKLRFHSRRLMICKQSLFTANR